MRLVLVSNSLGRGGGGAERVITTLANHWAERGWQVVAVTYDDGSVPPHYPVDGRIEHRPLALEFPSGSLTSAMRNALRRVRTLRQAFRAACPDAVISFGASTNVDVLLAAAAPAPLGGLGIPVIVSDRNDPVRFPDRSRTRAALRNLVYRRAAAIVFQTQRAAECFPATLTRKGHVIANPVAPPALPRREKNVWPPTLVALGRLEPQKGFDLLLEAFARIRHRHPHWHLNIVGEGSARGELEAHRRRLGIDDCVRLPGATREPERALDDAELFVLSSRFEGFPNALCEALAGGLPVVAADCRSGPREIVRDGVDGLLVEAESVDALAAGLDTLMHDSARRRQFAARAPEIVDRFGAPQVIADWERLLTAVVPHPRD